MSLVDDDDSPAAENRRALRDISSTERIIARAGAPIVLTPAIIRARAHGGTVHRPVSWHVVPDFAPIPINHGGLPAPRKML